jgi:hypothetical protein
MTTAAIAERVEELWEYLEPHERAALERDLKKVSPKSRGEPVPDDWHERIPLVFPRAASAPFADRHEDFWEWENAIELDSSPRPFDAVWPRGGAKSSSVEMAVSDLGCRNKRKYCLYVRMTQTKADDSVGNIALRLESPEISLHYPEHGMRMVGKFGASKGWRRNRVWTRGGFIVDAIGLDTATRGAKLLDQRPDLIVFDDIDDLNDGPAQTKKKINIITKSILPAGSNNCAVLFVQNLIIPDGVASQLADSRADFLTRRIVSGPFPAVKGLKYKWEVDPETGVRGAVITAGEATWEGQNIETCQRNIESWGLSAFLKEAQHEVSGKAEGVCLRFDPARHYVDIVPDQIEQLVRKGKSFAGVDPQWWRFGFVMFTRLPSGKIIRVAELFSQKENLKIRARKIHELCVSVGIDDPRPRTVPIWADAANPQDIAELNLAFREGWEERDEDGEETGGWIKSSLRVIAVANENKARKNAVQRINKLLDANALLFVRSVGADHKWLLGANASQAGTETCRSRLMWEIDNWAVPVPKEGEAQDDNPDDDTADGADLIAASRYALMSHLRKAKEPEDPGTYEDDRAWSFDVKEKKFKEPKHVADLLDPPRSRRPSVRAPGRGLRR